MVKNNSRLTGILGAVIIHLVAGILFMLLKLGSLKSEQYSREYEISLEEIAASQAIRQTQLTSPVSVEQVLRGDQEMLNIARNLANKPDEKINASDYIDMVKEEMIKNGQLSKDNYIDEQKRARESGGEQISVDSENENKEANREEIRKSDELASRYSGPTRIYYNLAGRIHTYLPIPIYKCEGSGKVVLAITVTPSGEVTEAKIITGESTATDQCLFETATRTARQTRFNADAAIPRNQTGTLTYLFVAQ